MPYRIYLDTNAASYAFRHKDINGADLRSIRLRMTKLASDGSLEFVISIPLLEELAQISRIDWSRYRLVCDFLFDIAGPLVLLEREARLQAEVLNTTSRGSVPPFLSRDDRRQLKAATRVRTNAITVADFTHRKTAAWKEFSEQLRRQLIDQLSSIGRDSSALRRACELISPQLDAWTTSMLKSRHTELGLPEDESKWPNVRMLRTAWLGEAFRLARVVTQVALGRRIEPSDICDFEHVSAGGYFDLLVTDDRRLVEACRLIPDLPFSIERFDEFVRRL